MSSLDVAPSRTALITLADLEARRGAHRAGGRAHAAAAVRSRLRAARRGRSGSSRRCCSASGAFKFRGAYNFLAQLGDEERRRGVVAPSSGNHAQAVALAARMFGVPAVVVMPTTVTPAKRAGAERLGARIELAGTTTQHRWDRARRARGARRAHDGAAVRPSVDHRGAGHGRARDRRGHAGRRHGAGARRRRRAERRRGGGDQAARAAARASIGVEPAGAPKLTRARAAGRPVQLGSTSGLADGLLAVAVGDLPFAHHAAYVDDVVHGGRRRAARRDARCCSTG